MKFTKMHGTGNDYIYINCFEETVKDPVKLAKILSDRHKGIGSDGLVLILPSEKCDFKMQMYNADGSESEMCGNASRCVGKYVYDKKLTNKKEIKLETLAGEKTLYLRTDDNDKVLMVTVDMGEPILDAQLIPSTFTESPVINKTVMFKKNKVENITCVSMGNPHTVLFVYYLDKINLKEIGPVIENAIYFPNRTNVEFVEVWSGDVMKMRVWERGSGETMACGTGACAALVAAVLNGLTKRKILIQLLGGSLEIEWKETDNHVYLTGDAVTVFEGEVNLQQLKQ